MAIFHYTIKIVGRSKGKSVISASAYLNGDVMKNEETGRISYYTSKKEVVYTSLMMCENAPPEWQIVPEENIKRFQKSVRYKRSEDKEAALEKFKITFQKQRLWNEVLKIEKSADAQLGRSFEFALPKEWSRQEQIQYTADYIKKTFVDKGMCADWSIHDKGDGNPHVHLLLTMRPFNPDHSWGKKEVKDWDFVRDKNGNIVIDESHPNWWQDKKNPDRHGIRIPVLDENGIQKIGARNRLQWKRVLTDATGWNNPKNCELWRSEWAKVCNEHLPLHNQVDHRSYEKQSDMFLVDCKSFFNDLASFIQTFVGWTIDAGHSAAQISTKIPNAFIAGMVYWLLLILIVGICMAGTGMLAILIEIKVIELYKKNCWDVITLLMILTSVAIVIYFGESIKKVLSVNLLLLFVLSQGAYVGIRCYLKVWLEKRPY